MKLERKYLFIILLTALLIVVNQIVIQFWLSQKRYDAQIINISGKQRMYSQKLLAKIQQYHFNPSSELKFDIEDLYNNWESTHYALINGNEEMNIAPIEQALASKLDLLSGKLEYAEQQIAVLDELDSDKLAVLAANQEQFLSGMNNVVYDLELSSQKKLRTIIILEIMMALITLSVILFEFLGVFKPVISSLTNQNKALNQASRSLEDYAFIASHDLKTPIHNIRNFSGLLNQTAKEKLSDEEKQFLAFITSGVDRIEANVNDLLLFLRANKVVITNLEFDPILEQLKAQLSPAELARVKFDIEGVDAIKADKKLFGILMENLISNALKFSKETVTVLARQKNGKTLVEVRDLGIGIAKEYKDHIFGLFKKLHNHHEYPGTGIGLALCKRIIEAHDGNIWIESEPGAGTSVFVSL